MKKEIGVLRLDVMSSHNGRAPASQKKHSPFLQIIFEAASHTGAFWIPRLLQEIYATFKQENHIVDDSNIQKNLNNHLNSAVKDVFLENIHQLDQVSDTDPVKSPLLRQFYNLEGLATGTLLLLDEKGSPILGEGQSSHPLIG